MDRTEGENKAIHRCWHYVDLPFSRDGTALKQPAKNTKSKIV